MHNVCANNVQAPKVFGNARTEEEVRLTYRKSTHFLNLQPSDLNQSVRSGALNESASFYTPRGRTIAQELFDCTDLHDEDKYELHRKRLVNMVLIELGHTPADDDLEFVAFHFALVTAILWHIHFLVLLR